MKRIRRSAFSVQAFRWGELCLIFNEARERNAERQRFLDGAGFFVAESGKNYRGYRKYSELFC
jgi:hypothetical protein